MKYTEGSDSQSASYIKKGTYRHTKSGRLYEVVGVSLHTETNEQLVVYRPLYKCEHELFSRPLEMFSESVRVNGEPTTPRFVYVG